MVENACPTCSRARWSGLALTGITAEYCTSQGSPACVLQTRVNTLVATLRILLRGPVDDATRRSCLAVLESAAPSSHYCPTCETPGVVVGGDVRVHFGARGDGRPCAASYGRVLGGVLIK